MRFIAARRARQHQCFATIFCTHAQDHEARVDHRSCLDLRLIQRAIAPFDLQTAIGTQRQRHAIATTKQPRKRLPSINRDLDGQLHCPAALAYTRLKASEPLVPPKPKLFLTAMLIFRSRA